MMEVWAVNGFLERIERVGGASMDGVKVKVLGMPSAVIGTRGKYTRRMIAERMKVHLRQVKPNEKITRGNNGTPRN